MWNRTARSIATRESGFGETNGDRVVRNRGASNQAMIVQFAKRFAGAENLVG